MRNWFDTLNEALESEGIIHMWDMTMPPISYGETRQFRFDDGTKHGHYVSIYRDESGRYERPIHYSCN